MSTTKKPHAAYLLPVKTDGVYDGMDHGSARYSFATAAAALGLKHQTRNVPVVTAVKLNGVPEFEIGARRQADVLVVEFTGAEQMRAFASAVKKSKPGEKALAYIAYSDPDAPVLAGT